ncbi:MAG: peptidoglycan-binding protein [Actinomycetota bacterium]|nr:peptidoglycan-binding protein [Actinomycetota bacterium]
MSTPTDWPLVKQGEESQNVRIIQYLLRQRGRNVNVDGNYGPATADAVRGFQKDQGLAVDGEVGDQTWSKLIVEVRRGSTGDAVRAVQEYFGLTVDGDFGPKTDEAVRAFQREWAPPDDGIVGPQTWWAIASPHCGA